VEASTVTRDGVEMEPQWCVCVCVWVCVAALDNLCLFVFVHHSVLRDSIHYTGTGARADLIKWTGPRPGATGPQPSTVLPAVPQIIN